MGSSAEPKRGPQRMILLLHSLFTCSVLSVKTKTPRGWLEITPVLGEMQATGERQEVDGSLVDARDSVGIHL